MFSFWALIVLPFVLAWQTVPHLAEVFRSAEPKTLLWVLLFGAGWGVANVGFGVGLRMLGMALGMAIVLGLNVALGSVLPILVLHREALATRAGAGIMAAVATMILGIVFCASPAPERKGPCGPIRPPAKQPSDSSARAWWFA